MFADRSRWPSRLRRRSTAARLLGSRVRIQLRAWTSFSCLCGVLCFASATGWSLVQGSLTVCVCVCLIVCDLQTAKWGRLGPIWAVASKKKKVASWLLVLVVKLGSRQIRQLCKKTVRWRELDGLIMQQRKQVESVGEILDFYEEFCVVVKCW